jgi:hypothetical protein
MRTTHWRLLLCAALVAASFISAPRSALAQSNCDQFIYSVPTVIYSPGLYCLANDISTSLTSGAAVQINSDDVTLDLNRHTLDGLPAGKGTGATGIFGDQRSMVVRNGTVRGFSNGMVLGNTGLPTSAINNVVENVLAERNINLAISVSGPFAIVRDNRVTDTGGNTGFNQAIGIVTHGPAARVLNNDVNHTFVSGGTGFGILFANGAVQNFAVNNRITGADVGISFSGGAGAGKYRDNLTSGVTTPFVKGGATDAGNNN